MECSLCSLRDPRVSERKPIPRMLLRLVFIELEEYDRRLIPREIELGLDWSDDDDGLSADTVSPIG